MTEVEAAARRRWRLALQTPTALPQTMTKSDFMHGRRADLLQGCQGTTCKPWASVSLIVTAAPCSMSSRR
jgi:hypothetical protein